MTKGFKGLAIAGLIGLALAGCGSGDDSSAPTTAAAVSTSPSASSGTTATSTVPSTGGNSTTPASSTPDSSAAPTLKQGGSLKFVAGSDVATLDPTTVINSASQGGPIMNALYDTLFTVDATGNIEGRLATDFATSDGITWTLTLRDGVKFSDGTALDADAVLAQWTRLKDNIRASAYSGLQSVASWSVSDPLTLEVVLKAPNRQFHQLVAWSSMGWIPSPTAVAAAGDSFGEQPVGAGPFVLKSRTKGSETVLERNPTFWESGFPKLDTLAVKVIADPQQALDTLTTGGADASLYITAEDAKENDLRYQSISLIGGNCWLFGVKSGPFTDIRARKAVYLALDMDLLNENVYEGKSTVATSLFPEGTEFHNPAISVPKPDPHEAQRLFDELAAEGKPVKFTIIGTPGNQAQMVELQTQLQSFDNVDVSINALDAATYGVSLYGGEFDLAVYGVAGRDPEPVLSSFSSDWPIPVARMGDPKIDAALKVGREAASHEERQAAYDQLQQLVNEQYRFKWMMQGIFALASSQGVDGGQFYGQGSLLVHNLGFVD